MNEHSYAARIAWSADGGEGTASYRSYSRDHTIGVEGKPEIPTSSDPAFRGSRGRYNPEELLVASLSSCHMLWYLHLCSANKIVVREYRDDATGTLQQHEDGTGEFVRVVLRPVATIVSGDRDRAVALHHEAHRFCFIARSVNFPVDVEPGIA